MDSGVNVKQTDLIFFLAGNVYSKSIYKTSILGESITNCKDFSLALPFKANRRLKLI